MYDGNPVTGKAVCEKGLVNRVVTDLVAPFEDHNHVVYCDNFFTSGPLVDVLAKHKTYMYGSL